MSDDVEIVDELHCLVCGNQMIGATLRDETHWFECIDDRCGYSTPKVPIDQPMPRIWAVEPAWLPEVRAHHAARVAAGEQYTDDEDEDES